MLNKLFFILLLGSILNIANAKGVETPANRQIEIQFYNEVISLSYSNEVIVAQPKKLEEEYIVAFFNQLNRSPYQPILTSIRQSKATYQLNDWLTYDLLKQTVDKIYGSKGKSYRVLAMWFYMSKLNFDTRLTFIGKEAFLYVRTTDNIYETPMIEDEGNRFVGLSELQYKKTSRNRAIYLLNFLAAPNGNSFSLGLNWLPNLTPSLKQKNFNFTWRGQPFLLSIEIDENLVNIMKKYPIIDESGYILAPFSKYLENSLLAQLEKILQGKPIQSQLEILATFTRSAFQYKEDERHFGRSKPMIREEVFFYPYSDCEDRSAVFYGLVQELLHLPMLVIAFPDHLTIAVGLEEPIGPAIKYKGKKYYICDPTGPNNSFEIGRIPRGYERKSFEILYATIN